MLDETDNTPFSQAMKRVRYLEQELKEATEVIEFNKSEWEAINAEGHKHMTAWQKCRDILKRLK